MASNATENSLFQKIMEAVEREVSEKSQAIVEKHKKQMGEELDAAIRDTVGKMGLRIAKYTDVQYANDRLVITISDERPSR